MSMSVRSSTYDTAYGSYSDVPKASSPASSSTLPSPSPPSAPPPSPAQSARPIASLSSSARESELLKRLDSVLAANARLTHAAATIVQQTDFLGRELCAARDLADELRQGDTARVQPPPPHHCPCTICHRRREASKQARPHQPRTSEEDSVTAAVAAAAEKIKSLEERHERLKGDLARLVAEETEKEKKVVIKQEPQSDEERDQAATTTTSSGNRSHSPRDAIKRRHRIAESQAETMHESAQVKMTRSPLPPLLID
jgi:hypothetical protein